MKTDMFRIYPARDNLALSANQRQKFAEQYWQVEIFDHRRQFQRRYRDISYPSRRVPMKHCMAIVCPRARYRRDFIKDQRLGFALYLKSYYVDLEIIAHEAVHQASHFIRLNRISSLRLTRDIDLREEILAYTIGICAKQFGDYFYG